MNLIPDETNGKHRQGNLGIIQTAARAQVIPLFVQRAGHGGHFAFGGGGGVEEVPAHGHGFADGIIFAEGVPVVAAAAVTAAEDGDLLTMDEGRSAISATPPLRIAQWLLTKVSFIGSDRPLVTG